MRVLARLAVFVVAAEKKWRAKEAGKVWGIWVRRTWGADSFGRGPPTSAAAEGGRLPPS